MKNYICLISFLLVASLSNGQAGIQFMGGLSNAMNKDAIVTPEGTSHPGYYFGADASLNQGNMYFIIGLQFHKLNFMPQTEKSYFDVNDAMSWMKIRVGLGYKIIKISDKIWVKAKTLGSINALSSYPHDFRDAPYDKFNSGTAAVVLGLGIEIHRISIGAEYEKGFFNAVHKVQGTEFDFTSFGISWRI